MNFSPHILKRQYNLEGKQAILLDRFGGRGYHPGTFHGGDDDHHDKRVSGEEMVRRIAWAQRQICLLQEGINGMVTLLNEKTGGE